MTKETLTLPVYYIVLKRNVKKRIANQSGSPRVFNIHQTYPFLEGKDDLRIISVRDYHKIYGED